MARSHIGRSQLWAVKSQHRCPWSFSYPQWDILASLSEMPNLSSTPGQLTQNPHFHQPPGDSCDRRCLAQPPSGWGMYPSLSLSSLLFPGDLVTIPFFCSRFRGAKTTCCPNFLPLSRGLSEQGGGRLLRYQCFQEAGTPVCSPRDLLCSGLMDSGVRGSSPQGDWAVTNAPHRRKLVSNPRVFRSESY